MILKENKKLLILQPQIKTNNNNSNFYHTMYQIFKDQLEKSKLIISGIKRNQRMGRDAGVEEATLQKLEDDCKRLEAVSAEIDKLRDELRKKSDEAHNALNTLKNRTQVVKRAVKSKYDQTWWTKFGIPDRR